MDEEWEDLNITVMSKKVEPISWLELSEHVEEIRKPIIMENGKDEAIIMVHLTALVDI